MYGNPLLKHLFLPQCYRLFLNRTFFHHVGRQPSSELDYGGCKGYWLRPTPSPSVPRLWEQLLHFLFFFLFLSPLDKQANSQSKYANATCYQYELPEQFFCPVLYKIDTTHMSDTHTHTHTIYIKNREKSANYRITVIWCFFIILKQGLYTTYNLSTLALNDWLLSI